LILTFIYFKNINHNPPFIVAGHTYIICTI